MYFSLRKLETSSTFQLSYLVVILAPTHAVSPYSGGGEAGRSACYHQFQLNPPLLQLTAEKQVAILYLRADCYVYQCKHTGFPVSLVTRCSSLSVTPCQAYLQHLQSGWARLNPDRSY